MLIGVKEPSYLCAVDDIHIAMVVTLKHKV
jgi:hypothetical protein